MDSCKFGLFKNVECKGYQNGNIAIQIPYIKPRQDIYIMTITCVKAQVFLCHSCGYINKDILCKRIYITTTKNRGCHRSLKPPISGQFLTMAFSVRKLSIFSNASIAMALGVSTFTSLWPCLNAIFSRETRASALAYESILCSKSVASFA